MNTTDCFNITDRIFDHAEAYPQDIAIIHKASAWTYAELVERVTRLGDCLTAVAAGGQPAPRIGLACADGLPYVVLALGLLRAGACVVPIASELARAERERIVKTLGLSSLVIGPGFDWAGPPGTTQSLDLSPFIGEPATATLCLGIDHGGVTLGFEETDFVSRNPAFIRFSSGTTAESKGVLISHETLFDRVRAANRALQIGRGDRVIWILPMAHHFAVSMMLYLTHGATTVVVGGHLAADVLDAAIAHGGTVLYGAPFHHQLLAADASGRAWPTLRLAVSTAATLTESTAQSFTARFGVPLSQALGIIEAGLPAINLAAAREKPTSIGRPTPGFEVELRDEAGVRVAPGEIGELWLRGPGMFDAYLLPWRPREAVTRDGWLHTGDLARRDADGDLFLMGRSKSVINVAGLKCFPEEVESVLMEHPEVAAVRVFGRAHPHVGAVPAAEVVPRDPMNPPTNASLSGFCRDRLATYKRPMQFTLVSDIARTASGKIKR